MILVYAALRHDIDLSAARSAALGGIDGGTDAKLRDGVESDIEPRVGFLRLFLDAAGVDAVKSKVAIVQGVAGEADCVFYGCKITVVYWSGNAKGCAMRNTPTHNNYVTGAWICAIGEDFDFSNNVISGDLSGVLFQVPVKKYNLANSLFAGNQRLYGSGGGSAVNFKPLEASVLALPASSKVTDKPIQIE